MGLEGGVKGVNKILLIFTPNLPPKYRRPRQGVDI
ncbi:hypothetical protein ACOMICROBIO_NCLOACGD_00411 [Vibrio sp. B1ASS3]|nr:hypothetical protein ACOMICROBIO_NCLOACGD_00411 [Vibrio sp. B1ASS3]CAE6883226.1 hypothetical protein ACOMICROBIO_NCLOACGD_00411 [Vibrio sp. B1ASS3]